MDKQKVFNIIQIGNKGDRASQAFDIFISTTIFVNVTVLVLQTYQEMASFSKLLNNLALITMIIFCIEYALRIWTANLLYPNLSQGKAILKFLFSFEGIIDLFTILPFFFLSGFIAFRFFRVIRIFHLFRINSQYDSFNVIYSVLNEKKSQILSSVLIVLCLMLASSIGMYYAEHEAQPDVFQNAFSGIWWSVSTMLTVGYGDIYPITTPGRLMAIITAFLGVGIVAIPTGIISAGFVEHYSRAKLRSQFVTDEHIDLLTVNINDAHCWQGLSLAEIGTPDHFHPCAIMRENEALLPTSDLKLKIGDTVILATDNYFLKTY